MMAHCYHISGYYTAKAIAAEKKRQCDEADRLMTISSCYLYAANGQRKLPVLA
jgi:hypothetical protein